MYRTPNSAPFELGIPFSCLFLLCISIPHLCGESPRVYYHVESSDQFYAIGHSEHVFNYFNLYLAVQPRNLQESSR